MLCEVGKGSVGDGESEAKVQVEGGCVGGGVELFLEGLEEAGKNVEVLGAGFLREMKMGKGGAVFS